MNISALLVGGFEFRKNKIIGYVIENDLNVHT